MSDPTRCHVCGMLHGGHARCTCDTNRLLRGALIELLASHAALEATLVECVYPDSDDLFKDQRKAAGKAIKRASKAIRETAIKL